MPLYDRETKGIPVKLDWNHPVLPVLLKAGVFTDNLKTLQHINKTLVTRKTELSESSFMANCFGKEIKNME